MKSIIEQLYDDFGRERVNYQIEVYLSVNPTAPPWDVEDHLMRVFFHETPKPKEKEKRTMNIENLACAVMDDVTTCKVVFQDKSATVADPWNGVELQTQYTYKVAKSFGLKVGEVVLVLVMENGGAKYKAVKVVKVDNEVDFDLESSKRLHWIQGRVTLNHGKEMMDREEELIKELYKQKRANAIAQAKAVLLNELGTDELKKLTSPIALPIIVAQKPTDLDFDDDIPF